MKDKLRSRILGLEAKLDKTLFGVYRDPATGKYLREDGTEATAGDFKSVQGAAAAVGTGAAIGGGVLGARKLMKRYGADQITSPANAARATAVGVGRDIAAGGAAVQAAGAKGVQAGRVSWGRNAAQGKPFMTKVGRALRAGLAGATGGRIRLSEVIKGRLVELAAKD